VAALQLTPVEARVIASLVEKSITTPQYYPMSANAIMLAANQKTCRAPVMNLSEGEVGGTLNRLEELKLVSRDTFSARVTKWRHAFHHQLMIDAMQMAVLATLILRGPQTLAELRANAAPLKGPADDAAMNAVLNNLMERATPLVALVPRSSGKSAQRYGHTLSGAPVAEAESSTSVTADEAPRNTDRLAALEARVAALEAQLAALTAATAASPPAEGP
jgi:uncharacterized protein